jgi:hypothetical protein
VLFTWCNADLPYKSLNIQILPEYTGLFPFRCFSGGNSALYGWKFTNLFDVTHVICSYLKRIFSDLYGKSALHQVKSTRNFHIFYLFFPKTKKTSLLRYATLHLCQRPFYKILVKFRTSKKMYLKLF